MDIIPQLKSRKKKTITPSELGALLGCASDEALSGLVSGLVSQGVLSPVRSAGTNGNRSYPLYLKYRITIQENWEGVRDEISMLHPLLLQSGCLQRRPQIYLTHREALNKLNRYLFQSPSPLPISRKERSFAIFDDEKQLEDSAFCRLLAQLGLTEEALHYYDTPEYCFHDYIPVRREGMTLLICENKDIWFNIRRRMYEDGCRFLFERPIDGVVYGSGNRVSASGALSAYTAFLAAHVRYLYWGDIDRAGLEIYLSLLNNNPVLSVELFQEAYGEMIALAQGRHLPDSEDHRPHTGGWEDALSRLPEQTARHIRPLLQHNQRLPQEIVSYAHLLGYMR